MVDRKRLRLSHHPAGLHDFRNQFPIWADRILARCRQGPRRTRRALDAAAAAFLCVPPLIMRAEGSSPPPPDSVSTPEPSTSAPLDSVVQLTPASGPAASRKRKRPPIKGSSPAPPDQASNAGGNANSTEYALQLQMNRKVYLTPPTLQSPRDVPCGSLVTAYSEDNARAHLHTYNRRVRMVQDGTGRRQPRRIPLCTSRYQPTRTPNAVSHN